MIFRTIGLFLLSFFMRILVCAFFNFYLKDFVHYYNEKSWFIGTTLGFWIISELLPILYIFYIHHCNFSDHFVTANPDRISDSYEAYIIDSEGSLSPM